MGLGLQHQLFARRALVVYPPQKATADSQGEVEADDGHRYYIKGDAHGKSVRASEWICTHLAEDIGIGAPAPAIIQLTDGTTVFGSRRIAGVADEAITSAYLTTPTVGNLAVPASGLTGVLSSIYALDMFTNNDDRHLGNYLSVDDNGVRRLYSFDFSRALFWNGISLGLPVPGANTRTFGAILRRLHGFDHPAATVTLDRLSSLTPNAIERFINRMPADWLVEPAKSEFLTWWGDGRRQARIDAIRKGVKDGSCL